MSYYICSLKFFFTYSNYVMRHESMITTLMRAFLYTTNQAKELTILINCDFSVQKYRYWLTLNLNCYN